MNLRDDSFWEFGLILTFYEAPNAYPQEPLLVKVLFKTNENNFTVKIGNDSKSSFTVSKENVEGNIVNIYEYIYRLVLDHFNNGLDKFLNQRDQGVNKIGFI